jgi:hypothetical protein
MKGEKCFTTLAFGAHPSRMTELVIGAALFPGIVLGKTSQKKNVDSRVKFKQEDRRLRRAVVSTMLQKREDGLELLAATRVYA